jgi:hypothetical protein
VDRTLVARPAPHLGLVAKELMVDAVDHLHHLSRPLLRWFVIIVVLVGNMAMRTIDI